MSVQNAIRIKAQRTHRGVVSGYAVDYARPDQSLVVVALIDGEPAGAKVADLFCEELAGSGAMPPRHGFSFSLAPGRLDSAGRVEIRVANREDLPGQSVDLKRLAAPKPSASVAWTGGLRFTGWIEAAGDAPPRVNAYIDETLVAEAVADRWQPGEAADGRPQRGFDLHLPPRFADGQVNRVHLRREDGRDLPGSPVTFWAAQGGLDAVLASVAATPGQRLQSAQFDRLLPNALPFSAYAEMRDAMRPPAAPRHSAKGWAVAVLAGPEATATLATLDAQSHDDWTCLALSEGAGRFGFSTEELGAFLASHANDAHWYLFVLAGVELDESALARFDAAVEAHPEACLLYCDREIKKEGGDLWPLALPAFDYERMLEQSYFAPAFALPRAVVERAVAQGVDNVFRLANFVFDDPGARPKALHLPGSVVRHGAGVLAGAAEAMAEAARKHLAARSCFADVEARKDVDACRVRRRRTERPSVSILIPTRDRCDLLRVCLQSILGAFEAARTEIVVIDNESQEPETLAYLAELRQAGVKVLNAPGSFNFSRLNNLAAREASGDFLCFLNNDVVALDKRWLDEMLSRHVDESVGAVGAKLLWPSGVVQHGGVTLGVNFAPVHAFRDRLDADPGYGGQMLGAHETGAVTAACMTTPRALFLECGGFDELRFPVNFNDVDYCLRLAARGLRIVFTPHAKLLHRESASRGRDERSDAAARFARELRSLRSVWGEALISDSSYSPLLALSDPPYAALASPPRPLHPRFRRITPARMPPPGF